MGAAPAAAISPLQVWDFRDPIEYGELFEPIPEMPTLNSAQPFLTALALWPKGDCWGGGGQFKTENSILLNHRKGGMKLAKSFRLQKSVRFAPFGPYSGWGEDSPLYEETFQRDGWTLTNPGKAIE